LQHTNNTTTNTKNTPITDDVVRISNIAESILASQGGYLADTLYSFSVKKNKKIELQVVKNEAITKFRWLIVGREHYFETSKEYPIANKRDVKQALAFEDNKAPFQGVTLHYIERISEQAHKVTFWVLKPKLLDSFSRLPWLVLPESYLLAKSLEPNINLAVIEGLNKTLFISKTGQGVLSGIKSSQTPNIENFAFSSGSPINTESEQFYTSSRAHFVSLLHKGIKALTLAELPGLSVKRKQFNWRSYPWKQAAITSSIIVALYLVFSSGWLLIKQYQQEKQLSEQTAEVNQALALQKQLQKQGELQKTLIEPLAEQVPYWNVWPVLLETISVGAKIKALHYKNDKITIHGTANKTVKATDILAALSQNPYVQSPSFSKPMRKYRGKEQFSIAFSFADNFTEALPNQLKEAEKEKANAK